MVKKLLLVLLILAPLSVLAQEKYAYVNAHEVLNKMPELGDMESKLATKQESMKKNMEAMQKEYQEKLQQLQDTTNVTQSIMQDRYRQLEQLQERMQTFANNSETEYRKEQETLFRPIQLKLQQAIDDVGNANSYTYIFDTNMLLYVNPKATDATKLVKTKLGITN